MIKKLALILALITAQTTTHAQPKTIGTPPTIQAVDEQGVAEILNWIRNIKSLSLPLTQINADGTQMQGQMDILHTGKSTDNTAGKMRLTYKNNPQYLVADGYWLWVVDTELKTTTAIDIADTPAWFILQPKSGIKRHGGDIIINTAQKIDSTYKIKFTSKQNPDSGHLTLWYNPQTKSPTRWQITDGQGGITTVLFGTPTQPKSHPKNHYKKPNYNQ